MSKPRLEGKVAIITGAASGIGEAAAKLFAEHGAFVVIADIQDEMGNQVVDSIGPEKASYRHCDVRDEKQVEETVDYAVERYGTLDIMYSNAGIIGPLGSILDLDMAEFDRTIATNLTGAVISVKHAARVMVANNIRGSIICTASTASTVGGSGPHAYTISKHGLLGLVRSAAYEFGKHGIRINCVSPFGVATNLSKDTIFDVESFVCEIANLKGFVLKAKHIAEAALFLASDESAYVSGQDLVVDGGFTVVTDMMSRLGFNQPKGP